MSERAWKVGDLLVRRHDRRLEPVLATFGRVKNDEAVDMVVVGLGEDCIAAEQSVLEGDGWELWKGLEQR